MKIHGPSNKKCVGVTIAVLFLVVAGTSWLGYVDPTIVEAYGLRAELFQYNWVIFPALAGGIMGVWVKIQIQTTLLPNPSLVA